MINTRYLGEGRHEHVKNVLFLLEIPPQRNKGELLQKIVIVTAKKHVSKITNNNK